MQRLQRLFIIALFGAIIFVANMFLPPPLNYLMMVVQSVLLALASLFIHKVGAMYVGAVGGLLTALVSPALGLFTFIFAFLYGVYVDVCLAVFRVKGSPQGVNRNRLMAAMAVSTLLHRRFELFGVCSFPRSLQRTRISLFQPIYSAQSHA
jgi:uncharacterized membrane protein